MKINSIQAIQSDGTLSLGGSDISIYLQYFYMLLC